MTYRPPDIPADVPGDAPPGDAPKAEVLPSTQLARIAWQALVTATWDEVAREYVFDTRILTNAQPYFAAYVKVADLLRVTDRPGNPAG